jgi:hypothetical protein
MTPNGNIYASANSIVYSSDYATTRPKWYVDHDVDLVYSQDIFIHEMVHVWQYRTMHMNVKLRRVLGFECSYSYDYGTFGTKDFTKYGIEQQAQIVQDYFLLLKVGTLYEKGEVITNHPAIGVYEKVLKKYFPNL